MKNRIIFDYYYGKEAEQFSFYRIPKLLFKDKQFKGLSRDAKILYGLMLDRMSLSIKNKWVDNENRVYINYTVESIMDDLDCSKGTCIKILKELDSQNGMGLIERKRQGLGNADKIYVKNFVVTEEKNYVEFVNGTKNELPEVQTSELKKSKKETLKSTENELVEVQGLTPNKNNIINTELNNNESIYLSKHMPKSRINVDEEMDRMTMLKNQIKENIEYDYLVKFCGAGEKELLEELYMIICDVVLSQKKTMKIAGNDHPTELVREKFMQLNQTHVQYVMKCLKNTTTKIQNIRAYIITALYNSTSSINFYYQQEVQHDMYGMSE